MAGFQVPTSEDLFQIYKAQLEMIEDINSIIVANKMNKKYYTNLKKNIKGSISVLNVLVNELNELSLNASGLFGIDLKNITKILGNYGVLMETIGAIPNTSLIGNKIKLIFLKRNLSQILKLATAIGSFNVIKIKIAETNLKLMEPIMESIEILMTPLKKLSIKDIIIYKTAVRRTKKIFKSLNKLIEYIADYRILGLVKAKKNTELINDFIKNISDVLINLDINISRKQIKQTRKAIKNIYNIFFGSFLSRLFHKNTSILELLTSFNKIDIKTIAKATITATLIKKMFIDLNIALQNIGERMSFLEKWKLEIYIRRLDSILFSGQISIVNIVKNLGEQIGLSEATKATIIAYELVLFMKAMNILIHSIGWFSAKRLRRLRRRIHRIYSLLFGQKEESSVLGLMKALSENQQTFKTGFQVLVDSVIDCVKIYFLLKVIKVKDELINIGKVWMLSWIIKTYDKQILQYIAKQTFQDRLKEAIPTLEKIQTSVEKFTKIAKEAPKFRELFNLAITVAAMAVVMLEYGGLLFFHKEIFKDVDEDIQNALLSTCENIHIIVIEFSETAKEAPKFKELLNLAIAVAAMAVIFLEYRGVLWIINKIIKKRGESDNKQAVQACKDMTNMLSQFTGVIKIMPKSSEIKESILSMAILMLFMAGWMMVLQLLTRSNRRSRKANRSIRTMSLAIGGILLVVAAVIAAGLLVILGITAITMITLFLIAVISVFVIIAISQRLIIEGVETIIWIGIAMLVISAPILIMAYAGSMLMQAGGGPGGAILMMLGVMGFIYLFAMLTAEVGALAETGLMEVGIGAMIGLGVAMIALTAPILMFAGAMKMIVDSISVLSKLEYSEDIFVKLVRSIVKAINAVSDISLVEITGAAYKFTLMFGISASIGKMAAVVRDVASLSIPTEFNEKGKPTAWTRMKDEDFENAAINASAITRIFAYMFSDKKHKLKLPGGRVMELGGTEMLEDIEKIRGKHKRRIKKLMKMVQSVGKMATVMQDLASMRIPETFDEKGNPTSWKKMDTNDFENAALNASVLMRMFVYMFDDENQHKLKLSDGSVISLGGTGISKILEDTKKRSIKKLKKIFELAEPMCKMVETIANVANLKMPETIDEKTGEVTKWKLAKIEDINGAVEKILEYTKTYINGFDLDKGKGKTVFDKLDDVKKRSIKKMNSVFELITPISTMMDTIIKINTGKYPVKINPITGEVEEYALFKNLENSTEPIFAVLNGFINGMTSILDNPNISKISDLPDFSGALSGIFTTDFEKYLKTVSENQSFKFTKIGNDINTPAGHAIGFIAKSIFNNVNGRNLQQRTTSWKQATDDSVKLVKSINTLDVSKADSLKNLLHELYLFSDSIQGNFDKLAEAINEKLIDALEKLDGTLNKVNEKEWKVEYEGSGQNTDKTVTDASKFTPTGKGKGAEVPKDKAAQKEQEQQKQMNNMKSDLDNLKTIIKKIADCVDGNKTLNVFVNPNKL